MLEWVTRETLVDVSINAVPTVVLAYFVLVTATHPAWLGVSRTTVLAHGLSLFPVAVLVVATYLTARAVERDAAKR